MKRFPPVFYAPALFSATDGQWLRGLNVEAHIGEMADRARYTGRADPYSVLGIWCETRLRPDYVEKVFRSRGLVARKLIGVWWWTINVPEDPLRLSESQRMKVFRDTLSELNPCYILDKISEYLPQNCHKKR